jgi:hypothetical protein
MATEIVLARGTTEKFMPAFSLFVGSPDCGVGLLARGRWHPTAIIGSMSATLPEW